MAKGHIHERFADFRERRRRQLVDDIVPLHGDAMLAQQVDSEIEVLTRDLAGQRAQIRARGESLILGHENVDAIRHTVDVLVDPLQLQLERFRGEAAAAQHAETAGATDRGDDVAAVTESEQREFRAYETLDGFHRSDPWLP